MSHAHRRAAKRDANEPEIVQALRKAGAVVWITSTPFDLLCGFKGRLVALEVKGKAGQLTPQQVDDFGRAVEAGLPVHVVRTAEEAVRVVRAVA